MATSSPVAISAAIAQRRPASNIITRTPAAAPNHAPRESESVMPAASISAVAPAPARTMSSPSNGRSARRSSISGPPRTACHRRIAAGSAMSAQSETVTAKGRIISR